MVKLQYLQSSLTLLYQCQSHFKNMWVNIFLTTWSGFLPR